MAQGMALLTLRTCPDTLILHTATADLEPDTIPDMMKSAATSPQGGGSARIGRSFTRSLKERFFLRFHMSLIISATVLIGLLSSKFLLFLQVDNIVIRYPLVVICSYLMFFLFVKVWLAYIFSSSSSSKAVDIADAVLPDPGFSFGGSTASPGGATFSEGGGGMSGGAGATGSFDVASSAASEGTLASPGGSNASSGIADAGDAVSGIFDDDGVVLIAIAVLLAAIFGSAVFLIYSAPHILSEAAFNCLLATSLAKRYRTMNKPDWVGGVIKDTYKPFLVVLIISVAAAWIIHATYPDVTKLSDLFP